jgi:hypothetical protein
MNNVIHQQVHGLILSMANGRAAHNRRENQIRQLSWIVKVIWAVVGWPVGPWWKKNILIKTPNGMTSTVS